VYPLLFLLHFYFGLSFVGDPSSFLVATVLYAFCVASFGTMVGAAIPALSFENLFARNPCTSVLRLGFQAEILSVPLFGNLVDHFPGDWIFLLWTPLS
jgi:hypothetical protein